MNWPDAVLLGALGGAVVQLVAIWGSLMDWQQSRRDFLAAGTRPLPSLAEHVDPLADTLVAFTRVCLGAVAGLLFHSQVTGATAAIAIGAAAPALLARIGTGRTSAEVTTDGCADAIVPAATAPGLSQGR